MISYADYDYYTVTYLAGKEAVIDAASFTFYARQATQQIRMHTFGNISDNNIPDEVKMCCCEVAESMCKAEKEDSKGVSSEKIGEYSISYVSPDAKQKVADYAVENIIYQWLSTTGLLYRGCC